MKKARKNKTFGILAFSAAVFILLIALVHWGAASHGNRGLITFDRGNCGFEPVGEPRGTAMSDPSPPLLTNGVRAIKYSYETKVDQYSGIGAMGLSLNNFSALRIRIYSEKERTIGVVVDEEESGAHYVYSFKAPAGKWIEETCPPDLFMLSPGSTDSNSFLDTEKLNSRLIIADMSGFQGVLGPNTLWISRIEISRDQSTDKEKP